MGVTSEQAGILAERGRDVLVTAGAGSGKTRVLVDRYVSLLADHRISEMAAVTFTDAAATEMRERVRREVLTREELRHHRAEIDEAIIGTIHSLCLRILRDHPVEAAIDPATRVLADDEAEFELTRACIDALEAAADADDQRALALRELGLYAATLQLPLMVARRDEVEAAYRALPGETVESWAAHVRKLLEAHVQAAVEEARPVLAERAAWLSAALEGSGDDALSSRLGDCLAALGDPDAGDASDLLARVEKAGGRVNLRGGSARNWAADIKEVKEAMGSIRDMAKGFKALPRWNDYDQTALEALASLRRLFDDACTRYSSRKQELVALDYLDLEIRATELLSEHPEIAAAYGSRLRHLMVDELQDTNPTQIKFLDLLKGPERFFVGDVKQAIYRFRGSDVRNFTRLHTRISASGAIHSLSQSFRAHDPLVGSLNALFEHVFEDPREEFEAPMQAMTGRGTEAPESPYLVLLPVSNQTPEGGKTVDEERRKVEADAVAAEVASLLGRPVDVWDRDEGEQRPARASDVAILLRRLSNVHLFEQALESRGVPCRTVAGAGFFTRQEVLDLTNLLGWLAEPDDSISLAGALRSPLFTIDDQSLLSLRSHDRNLLTALGDPPESLPAEARRFCRRSAEVLQELRDGVAFLPTDALLERALALTGFEAAWAPLQGGDQALANIRKFVDLARQLAGTSLDEFVAYVRRRRDELQAREGQAVLDQSDAVRLLTVHGAKGLQFPIVFVPEAHLPSRVTYEAVRWRTEEGISLTLEKEIGSDETSRRRPGFYSYLLSRDEAEETAEHKRLFYVAATRAADVLYITGDDGKSGDTWLGAAQMALGAEAGGVEIRPPIPVDLEAIARRAAPGAVPIPPEDEEEDFVAPLVARPPVIPLRSSTPVTSLRLEEPSRGDFHHGDGLGLVRGSLAHDAIEEWFRTGRRPRLDELIHRVDSGLGEQAVRRVVADVDGMLDIFDRSPLAVTLRDGGTRAYFELPISWDWDGVPVHGTIDVAYETGGTWHVLDFKTDDLRGRSLADASQAYLPQLALYASALERAVGGSPVPGLMFLRTGDVYLPPPEDLTAALAAVRDSIDHGGLLDTQGHDRDHGT